MLTPALFGFGRALSAGRGPARVLRSGMRAANATAIVVVILIAGALAVADGLAYYRAATGAKALSDARLHEWRASLAAQRAILNDKEPQLEQEYLDARAAYDAAMAARRAKGERTLSLTNDANEMNAAYASDVEAVRKAHERVDALMRAGAPKPIEIDPAPFLMGGGAIAVMTLAALVAFAALRRAG